MSLLLSTNRQDQTKEIAKTIAIKLWLEDKMNADLKSLFKKMSTAFAEHYSHHDNIINLNQFDIDMTACLRKWYRKTADIFSKNIRNDLKSSSDLFEFKASNLNNSNTDKQKINAEIAATLLVFIEKQSKEQTQMIMDTSKSIIKDSVQRIRKELMEAGEDYSKRAIAEAVRKDFNERSIARSDLISKQEVGLMASESKDVEATVLNKSNAVHQGLALENILKKNWNAELDNSTRIEHAQADFKYKFNPIRLEDYFIVWGESLKYPRDPSGSARNIINCRCETLYIAKPL